MQSHPQCILQESLFFPTTDDGLSYKKRFQNQTKCSLFGGQYSRQTYIHFSKYDNDNGLFSIVLMAAVDVDYKII